MFNNSKSDLYARKNEMGDLQTLIDHLENVSIISRDISLTPALSMLLGYLHDIGKATSEWQNYLLHDDDRGRITHSYQGAFFAVKYFDFGEDYISVLIKDIIRLSIMGHHSEIPDFLSPDGDFSFDDIFQADDKTMILSRIASQPIVDDVFKNKFWDLLSEAKKEINSILIKIKQSFTSYSSCYFAIGLLVKYIYSCLIDTDRYDAFLFETSRSHTSSEFNFDQLINIFEEKISKFDGVSKISTIRKNISVKCLEAAEKDTGIYKLSVPTGGGKTLSSLRYALHHAKKHNKKKIIYVIPFLSIIDQTAKTFRDILNLDTDSDVLLEDHSGIVEPDDEETRSMRNIATSRYSSPIIITTMVQFLESIVSARGSKLRRLSSMRDSVIIFDEIQSLPLESIHLFNEVITFLSRVMGSTILLCTATQPLLDKTFRKNLTFEDNSDIVENATSLFSEMNRVNVIVEEEKDISSFSDFVFDTLEKNDNCLVIMNTKKTARDIFTIIKNKDPSIEVLHLSTSMCPEHRMNVIEKIRSGDSKKKRICISTQLIEAGVDISFSCVVKAMAGLDSITQAAGRCNRHGEYASLGNVYVVPLKGESLDQLPGIKLGKTLTARLIRENPGCDLLSQSILDLYYHYYFEAMKDKMDFTINDDGIYSSVYELLSINKVGVNNYYNRYGKVISPLLPQAFATASKNYKVIGDNTKQVVVYYGKARELIDEYRVCRDFKRKLSLIKKLEKFSVSLFVESEFKNLCSKNVIEFDKSEYEIMILNENYYDDDLGVIFDSLLLV